MFLRWWFHWRFLSIQNRTGPSTFCFRIWFIGIQWWWQIDWRKCHCGCTGRSLWLLLNNVEWRSNYFRWPGTKYQTTGKLKINLYKLVISPISDFGGFWLHIEASWRLIIWFWQRYMWNIYDQSFPHDTSLLWLEWRKKVSIVEKKKWWCFVWYQRFWFWFWVSNR